MSRRSPGPDMLRLFGVLAIVVGHAVPNEAVRVWTFSWHVPMFFVLAGYFWSRSRSLNQEIQRRFQTILIPYFTWLLIIAVPLLGYEVATESTGQTIRRAATLVLGGTYLKSPYEAYWFLCALFVAAVAYRAVTLVLQPRWANLVFAGVVALTFLPGMAAKIPYSIGIGITATFFILVGALARDHPVFVRLGWPVALAIGATVLALRLVPPLDMKVADWGLPVVSFLTAGLVCLGLLGLFEVVFRSWAPKWAMELAPISLVVVLTHGIPIYLLAGRAHWSLVLLVSLGFGIACALAARNRPSLTGRGEPSFGASNRAGG